MIMARTLEKILQTYFGCKVPFRKDGDLTTTGVKAVERLKNLMRDLEQVDVIWDSGRAVRVIDRFIYGERKPVYEKLSFEELTSSLQYFSPDDPMDKTIDQIAEEFREFIRQSGFECLDEVIIDEDSDATEYIDEHHPDWDTDKFEWYSVTYQDREFLCSDECYPDPIYKEMHISFYGDWDNHVGVFCVTF